MPQPLHGINGRLRQHITKVSAEYANRILSAKRKEQIEADAFLKELLDTNQITLEQLRSITGEHLKSPSQFSWLGDHTDSILDRADDVFYAKFGRDPTKDSDFRWGGDYYRICNELRRNWHHYNADLEKLSLLPTGQIQPPQSSTQIPSVEDIVGKLLQSMLGDVIPQPKERKKKYKGERFVFPWYSIYIRGVWDCPFPDYDSNQDKNTRIRNMLNRMSFDLDRKLLALKSKRSYGYLTYVDIVRIPTVLVHKVTCWWKPYSPWETVFQNWP